MCSINGPAFSCNCLEMGFPEPSMYVLKISSTFHYFVMLHWIVVATGVLGVPCVYHCSPFHRRPIILSLFMFQTTYFYLLLAPLCFAIRGVVLAFTLICLALLSFISTLIGTYFCLLVLGTVIIYFTYD